MVKAILPVTYTVMDDEPCYWLTEQHLQSEGSRGFRRYQILWVVRQDRLHQFVQDLGPASAFKGVAQFNIVGGITDEATGKLEIDETVGSLREIADQQRNGLGVKAEYEPRDLKGDLLRQLDEQRMAKAHRSTFGAHQRIERH